MVVIIEQVPWMQWTTLVALIVFIWYLILKRLGW